ERNLALVSDPFTAASIVAAGAAPKAVAERLRGLLRAALHQTADGAAELPVPEGVVRADGRAPLPAEATALAALALDDARVRADPPLAGLGFSLSLQSWVPWHKQPAQGGLELQAPPRIEARLGQPVSIELEAAAPSGSPLSLHHALPAGVQPDLDSLDALVA